jgi:hypothetical protein
LRKNKVFFSTSVPPLFRFYLRRTHVRVVPMHARRDAQRSPLKREFPKFSLQREICYHSGVQHAEMTGWSKAENARRVVRTETGRPS